ncbi:hypothetical protein [Pontibacter russatus]|uniref:hypothetical protein n=1 Tax=Pontibacter russatus TaxID=2694929 RepID=UPI00137A5F66|nr:hypothetical protein [Pontibacter russatus]
MENVKLNESNSSFHVSGSEAMRSLRIEQVWVRQWPERADEFKLIVLDEKDVPIYRQILHAQEAPETAGTDTIAVGKEFAFYDHLSVVLTTEPGGVPFSAEIIFK